MDTNYNVSVKGRNTIDKKIESPFTYVIFKTPSCLEWFNNDLTKCGKCEFIIDR